MTEDDPRVRLLSYLRNQCAKLSPAEVGARVDAAYAELSDVLAGLTPAQAVFRPASDGWSIGQIVSHLNGINEECYQVASRMARGGEASTAQIPTATSADPLSLVKLARERVAGLVREMGESPRLDISEIYHTLGPLNCKEVLLFERVHAVDHLQQVRDIRAHPAFPR